MSKYYKNISIDDYKKNALNYHKTNNIKDFGILCEKAHNNYNNYKNMESFEYLVPLNTMELWTEIIKKLLYYHNDLEHQCVIVILPHHNQIALLGQKSSKPLLEISNEYEPNRIMQNSQESHFFLDDHMPRGKIHQLLIPRDYYKNLLNYWHLENDHNKQKFLDDLLNFYHINQDNYVLMTTNIGTRYQSQPQLHIHCISGSTIK